MPSRKQRRRRAKLQRHEYEYVMETEEGEVPVERPRQKEGSARDGRREPQLLDRRGRPIPKPSLQRVLRRALIFAPILLLFVYFMSGNRLSMAGIVLNAVILVALFIPFSYLVDVVVYRMVLRRHEREHGASSAR
ncbi:MAG: hypothetical protein ICV74_09245 [Thermoleophilia bacterium]|nr:hypothetical protein [Thermoleophilia bacterium]